MGFNFRAAAKGPQLNFEHEEQENGGSKRPSTHTLHGVHPDTGDRVGWLKYDVPRRKADKIYVQRMEVAPEHKGNGYAGQLMDEMQRRHPNTPIDHGDRTTEGQAWWDSYTQDKPVRRGRTVAAREEDDDAGSVDRRGSDLDQATGPEEPEGVAGDETPASCSYCGSTDFEDLTDNGRVRQATCAACGGTMSAHEGAQWTPELIGDPSNHPKSDGDPRSGGVGGAAAVGMDPIMRDTSRLAMHHEAGPREDEQVQQSGLPLLHSGDTHEERVNKLTHHYEHLSNGNGDDDADYLGGHHPLSVHHKEHGVPAFTTDVHYGSASDIKAPIAAHMSRRITQTPPRHVPTLDVTNPRYDAHMGEDTLAYHHPEKNRIAVSTRLAMEPESHTEGSHQERGWFSKSGDASTLGRTMTHEYGHLLDHQIHNTDDNGYEGGQHRAEMFRELSKHIPGAEPFNGSFAVGANAHHWVKANREHIINHVGTYAAKDDDELVAELYAEHHHSPSPSMAAQAVGNHLDQGAVRHDHGSADAGEAGGSAGRAAAEGAHPGSGRGHREGARAPGRTSLGVVANAVGLPESDNPDENPTTPTKRVGFAGYIEGEKTNFGRNEFSGPDWDDEQAVGAHGGVHEFRGFTGRENDFKHWHTKGEITHVPLRGPNVYATQARVTNRGVNMYLRDPDKKSGSGRPNYPANERPMFVKHGGEYYTLDGHHRTAAAMLRGDEHVEGHVYDADKHGFPAAEEDHGWTPYRSKPRDLNKYASFTLPADCDFQTEDDRQALQHELAHHDDGFCSAPRNRRTAKLTDPEMHETLSRFGHNHQTGTQYPHREHTLTPVKHAGFKGYVEGYEGQHEDNMHEDREAYGSRHPEGGFDEDLWEHSAPEWTTHEREHHEEWGEHPDQDDYDDRHAAAYEKAKQDKEDAVKPVAHHGGVFSMLANEMERDYPSWHEKGEIRKVDVGKHDVYATQPHVVDKHVNRYLKNPGDTVAHVKEHGMNLVQEMYPGTHRPMMVKHENNLFTVEGHHRVASALLRREPVEAMVYDADKHGFPHYDDDEDYGESYEKHEGLQKHSARTRIPSDCEFNFDNPHDELQHAIRHHDDGVCTATELVRHGESRRTPKEAAVDGPDWCTWRQAAQCTFPNDRNNTLLAIPQVRGACPWTTRYAQQICPISEPGPQALMSVKASSYRYHQTFQTANGYEDQDREIEGPLYHGGRAKVGPGDHLTIGRKPNSWGDDGGKSTHNYFTTDRDTAASYAHDLGNKGRLYEVEPTGDFKMDHSEQDFKTPHPLRVIREVPHEEWAKGMPKQASKALSWDEIGDRHPEVYGDSEIHGDEADGADGPGIGDAANYLAHERPGHQDAEDSSVHNLDFHEETVHPRHIDYAPSGSDDPRVRSARKGYQQHPHEMPPLVLVKRHNVYQVADGHHRAEAAHGLDMPVKAYVAHSPHDDKPFADGHQGAFYGAQPVPAAVSHENDLRAHMVSDHGYNPDSLSRRDDRGLARFHDNEHFDCPAEFHSKMGSLRVMSNEDNDAYRMQHQAPDADYGAPAHDLSKMFPADVYTHPHYYDTGHADYYPTHSKIRAAQGNPEKKIRIYRALPAEHAHKGFATGDWVSTSKEYARDHGRHHEDPKHDWPVISTTVPAKHIHTEGDLMEWGYNGPHKGGSVAFKGGHHQEVSQRADGSVRPVQRKAKSPERQAADTLKENGYSFSHYRPGRHDDEGEHTIAAYDPDENWAGMIKGRGDGSVHHVEIDPAHKHMPLEQHMRNMLKQGAVKTPCQTPGAQFHTTISDSKVGLTVDLHKNLGLNESEATLLESNMHNAMELVLRPYYKDASLSVPQAYEFAKVARQDPEFGFHVTAAWSDVRSKAKRIRSEGKVMIKAATNEGLAGMVEGDHGTYENMITYRPGTRKIADWSCNCEWGDWAWKRIRFHGRQCSHSLALQYEAQSRGMFGRDVHLGALAFGGSETLDERKGISDAPISVIARSLVDAEEEPGDIMKLLMAYGLPHSGALALIKQGAWWDEENDDDEAVDHQRDEHGNCVFYPDHEHEHHDEYGEGSKQCPYEGGHTDWDRVHPKLGPEVHRGMSVDLHRAGIHHMVHDQSRPVHERAQALEQHLTDDHLGTHWTDNGEQAKHYTHVNASGPNAHHTKVVLHADKPARHEIEEDPDELASGDVIGYDKHDDAEIPLQHGGDVRLKGISFHSGGEWHRHDFPEHKQHIASENMTEAEEDRRRKKHHHTNDTRRHAPNFGYGVPGWIGLPIGICGQCTGWGCGHCGGTGQVAQDGHGNTADAVPDQNGDEGQMMSGGISDTSSLLPRYATGATLPVELPAADQATTVPAIDDHGLRGVGVTLRAGGLAGVYSGRRVSGVDVVREGLDGHVIQPHAQPMETALSTSRGTPGIAVVAGVVEDELGWNLPDRQQPHEAMQVVRFPLVGGSAVPVATPSTSPHVAGVAGSEHDLAKQAGGKQEVPTVAGVCLKAADTGRILMLQRGLQDEDDPARGTWENPGGHIEPGDQTSLHAGVREFEEEVGQPFPEGGVVHHTWTSPNGIYQGHVVVIPSEKDLRMHEGRVIPNPDDPKGDNHEQAAWWDIDHARKNPALREELKTGTPWKDIAKAGTEKTASAWDPLTGEGETPGFPYAAPLHSNSKNPASTGFATSEDPKSWSNENEIPDHLLPSSGYDSSYYGMLHDEPEPALPSTDGADPDGYQPPETHGSIPDVGESLSPNQFTGSVNDIVATFQATAGAQGIMANTPASTPGGGDVSFDFAAAARQYLAQDKGMQKSALKDFSFPEQQELINEGKTADVRARNFSNLQIEGTHYEALSHALGLDDEDAEGIFS